jgi:hypothetical protein
MMGNPLMNDTQLSQTAGRTETRQPGLLVKPAQIVLSSYFFSFPRLQQQGQASLQGNFFSHQIFPTKRLNSPVLAGSKPPRRPTPTFFGNNVHA